MIRQRLARPERVIPAIALALSLAAFLGAPLRDGQALETFDVYNALQGFAQVGLLALAIGLTMVAGEFDLSVVGTYALGGLVAVELGQSSPVLGVLAAVGCGVLVGAVQGALIAGLRIPSMPVTLATYITLLGLTHALSGGLSVSYTNFEATLWVDQTVATVFSPRSLITLGAFALVALLLGFTRLGAQLRAVGGDRRASRVAGVRVERTLLVLFMASGALAALGGSLLAYSFASANPDPGLRPLLIAAVAALLGGVSLAGGRGAPLGLLAGALAVALLAQVVTSSYLPDYWIQLFYAALLVVIVAVDSPGLRRGLDRVRARGVSRPWGT